MRDPMRDLPLGHRIIAGCCLFLGYLFLLALIVEIFSYAGT